jgi:hypothetical protein
VRVGVLEMGRDGSIDVGQLQSMMSNNNQALRLGICTTSPGGTSVALSRVALRRPIWLALEERRGSGEFRVQGLAGGRKGEELYSISTP